MSLHDSTRLSVIFFSMERLASRLVGWSISWLLLVGPAGATLSVVGSYLYSLVHVECIFFRPKLTVKAPPSPPCHCACPFDCACALAGVCMCIFLHVRVLVHWCAHAGAHGWVCVGALVCYFVCVFEFCVSRPQCRAHNTSQHQVRHIPQTEPGCAT